MGESPVGPVIHGTPTFYTSDGGDAYVLGDGYGHYGYGDGGGYGDGYGHGHGHGDGEGHGHGKTGHNLNGPSDTRHANAQ